jgi:hypothetical protein
MNINPRRRKRMHSNVFFAGLGAAAGLGLVTAVAAENDPPAILEASEVAPAWSVHRIGEPVLLTRDDFQYVGFYDHEARLTVAQRKPGTAEWSFQRFPVRMGWATGAHAKLSLAVDRDGFIHLASYRRTLIEAPPAPHAIYYRSEKPHDIGRFERLTMVSEDERPDYPTFFTGPDGRLYFHYRSGVSGQGNQVFNQYDPDSRKWSRLYDTPLFDGRKQMNAYGGPRLGPDGIWHALWVWRDTPCNATNHSLSYMRSPDLLRWETIAGEPVKLPVTNLTPGVIVEPAGPGGGLSNMTFTIGWDSRKRPVVTYHKFDDEGNSQIYNARFDDGQWRSVRSTAWMFRWAYEGPGALPRQVTGGAVSPAGPGRLQQVVWNIKDGSRRILLDEATLAPVGGEAPETPPVWRRKLSAPELAFRVPPNPDLLRTGGPMEVILINDQGGAAGSGAHYVLRWEHAGGNRDMPVPKPWPEPTMLRVYKIAGDGTP